VAGAIALVLALHTAPADGTTKDEILAAATVAAERLPHVRMIGRTWEDVPYLVGLVLLARRTAAESPDTSRAWIDRATAAVGTGDGAIGHGDYAGYGQAAMDLFRTTPLSDASLRAELLAATDGPLAFAARAIRVTPANAPPASPWWVEGGYGTRFWVDDLFTQPPGLALRGSALEGLPADPLARDLAYEWIESYLYDHRPAATSTTSPAVPTERRRAGPLLWNPALNLFRHDPGAGAEAYWGRGNGWAAWGLARAARYLDTPYGGGRFDLVPDRTALREVLARLAGSLAARRADDGGWPADLLRPEVCGVSETSATGLLTYALARGVNEGWLDRATFTPIVLKALSVVLARLDASGDVTGIQPPGTGPDCGTTTSNDPGVDVSYGVGALLLAASEALDLPDVDLAKLDEESSRPIDRTPIGPTWHVALPADCEEPTVSLTNSGATRVHARLGSPGGGDDDIGSVDIPSRGAVSFGVAQTPVSGSAFVLTVRADGELAVQPRGVCGAFEGADEPRRRVSRPTGTAAPSWGALAAGESTTWTLPRSGGILVGGRNVSTGTVSLRVSIAPNGGETAETFVLTLPAESADLERRAAPSGSRITFVNVSSEGAVVPLAFASR
jgi:hypothetical protein